MGVGAYDLGEPAEWEGTMSMGASSFLAGAFPPPRANPLARPMQGMEHMNTQSIPDMPPAQEPIKPEDGEA